MKQKQTAMQEMYDSMLKNEEKAFELGLPEAGGYQSARILAERLLETEKQQIIDALNEGSEIIDYDTSMPHEFKWVSGLQYFNQTFNK